MVYLKFLLYVIVAILILSLVNFFLSIHPPKYRSKTTPKDFNLEYENVSFKTSDNLLLKGWFIPNKESDVAIIIAHGYPFDKSNIIQATHFLSEKYNLLLFDFRYFGESEGIYTTGGIKESKDMLIAIEFLKGKNFIKIGAMGFSMGGAAILMSESNDLKAMVIDSSYASMDLILEKVYSIFPGFLKLPFIWLTKFYGFLFFKINPNEISPLNSIQKINSPILLIHGEKDSQISVKNSKILYANSNKNKTELWIVPNADHGMAYALYPEEYKNRVIKFFDKNLK